MTYPEEEKVESTSSEKETRLDVRYEQPTTAVDLEEFATDFEDLELSLQDGIANNAINLTEKQSKMQLKALE
jgi:hypothetical protein